jgi:hypothetical protein
MSEWRWMFALAAVFALGAAVEAADVPKADAKAAKKEAKQSGATLGAVEKVDMEKKQIVIRVGKKNDAAATSVTVTWDDKTKFEKPENKDKKAAAASDVTAGVRVAVKKDDKNLASLVTILPKGK